MTQSINSMSTLVRCYIAGVLNMIMLLVFNGTLYLAYDGIFDWSRDVSTLADVALLLALLAVARRYPARLRPLRLSAIAIFAGIAGYALSALGVVVSSSVAIVVGVLLVCVSDVWGLVLWLLSMADLDRRQACLCLAVTGALGTPIGYALNEWAPYALINVLAILMGTATILLCLPLTRPFFERLATVGIPAEQEIAHPRAFLPLQHPFYVYIFLFSVAYGFALRCQNYAGPAVSSIATLLVSLAIALYALHSKETPQVDALFVASFFMVAVGFMLALTGEARVADASSALLMGGYVCLQLLTWLALCAAAGRNTVDAIPTICWGTAVGYTGIVVGAMIWLVPNYALAGVLAGDNLLQSVLIIAVLAVLVLYTLLTRHAFVFDAAIEGIEPDAPAPQVEVQYVDTLAERCEEIAAHAALTSREADVMRLLAHGYAPSRIQDDLGIGYNTVKYHVRNIYAKLGVHSQQELIDMVCETD